MPPNAVPKTPGMSVTGAVPVTPPNPAIPLEKLLESLKTQNEMKLQKTDTSVSGNSMGGASAPGQNPPK